MVIFFILFAASVYFQAVHIQHPDAASVDLGNSLFFAAQATPKEPLTCFYGATLRAPTTLAKLRAAVASAMRQTPRLASVCARGQWRPIDAALDRVVLAGEPATAQAMLGHYIDLAKDPAWRVVFVSPTQIHFGIHHGLCDGMGMGQILSDVLLALAGRKVQDTNNMLQYAAATAPPLDAEWIAQGLAQRRAWAALPVAQKRGEISLDCANVDTARLYAGFSRMAACVPEITAQDYLLSALHLALGTLSTADDIIVWQPIDLRRQLPDALRIGNQVTSGYIASSRALREDHEALCKSIVAQTRGLKAHKLEARVVERLAMKERLQIPALCGLANLGAQWSLMPGEDTLSDILCAAGPRAAMPFGTLLALTWREKTRLSWARFAPPGERGLLETLVEFL